MTTEGAAPLLIASSRQGFVLFKKNYAIGGTSSNVTCTPAGVVIK